MPATRERVESRGRKILRRADRRTARHKMKTKWTPPERFDYGVLDSGIVWLVKLLHRHKFKTIGSCQGGEGHSYPFPVAMVAYERVKVEFPRLRAVMQSEGTPCTVSLHYALQTGRIQGDSSYMQVQIWRETREQVSEV